MGDVAQVISSTIKTIKKIKPNFNKSNKQKISKWWEKIEKWRSVRSLDYINSEETIKPQYAVQRLYELTKDKILLLQLRLVNIKCGLLNITNLINQIDG